MAGYTTVATEPIEATFAKLTESVRARLRSIFFL